MAEKINIDAAPDQVTVTTSSLMIYPRCLSRLSACEVVSTLDSYGTNIGSYIENEGGACYVKHREFVYVGEPVPGLNEKEHAAFLINFQKSILLSLEKRNLLTASQRERCLLEIEKQYSLEMFYVNR